MPMKRATAGRKDRSLERLCDRVQLWREHRSTARARIPEDIWNAAVVVAQARGVYATAKAAHFEYKALKQRVEQAAASSSGDDKMAASAFIQMQMPSLSSGADSGRMVVELMGRGGGRMRIELGDSRGLDVVGLAQAFWSHEP
jgi:hypothetical protein